MTEYFYLKDNDRLGPFSYQQLQEEPIFSDTLIWFDDLDDWTPLSQIAHLQNIKAPPPPPSDKANEKQPTSKKQLNKPNKNKMIKYFFWVGFLIILYALTLTDNNFIQKGTPDVAKIWPLTADFYSHKITEGGNAGRYFCTYLTTGKPCFYGVLADYDLTEVLIYSLIPLMWFVARKKKK